MNYKEIIETREHKRQQGCDAKLAKMEDANAKHLEKVEANRDAVQRLLKAAEEGEFW